MTTPSCYRYILHHTLYDFGPVFGRRLCLIHAAGLGARGRRQWRPPPKAIAVKLGAKCGRSDLNPVLFQYADNRLLRHAFLYSLIDERPQLPRFGLSREGFDPAFEAPP